MIKWTAYNAIQNIECTKYHIYYVFFKCVFFLQKLQQVRDDICRKNVKLSLQSQRIKVVIKKIQRENIIISRMPLTYLNILRNSWDLCRNACVLSQVRMNGSITIVFLHVTNYIQSTEWRANKQHTFSVHILVRTRTDYHFPLDSLPSVPCTIIYLSIHCNKREIKNDWACLSQLTKPCVK